MNSSSSSQRFDAVVRRFARASAYSVSAALLLATSACTLDFDKFETGATDAVDPDAPPGDADAGGMDAGDALP
ncbi:MAG: hypothetical protein ABEL76_17005, partial [Bradymonadaceae bacterium]